MRLFHDRPLTPLRRVVQGIVILAMVAILITGQVAVDRQTQGLDLFGQVVWFHEMSLLLLGLALPMAILAALSVLLGRAFCGWLCPQTALCELFEAAWRIIGRARTRSLVAVILTSVAIGAAAAMTALALGLALAAVVVSPATVLGIARGEFTTSLLKGITIATLMILFLVALLRHGFCEWICVVGWWQRLFANGNSLSVVFARDRAKECLRCNECKTTCFMGIDPRRPNLPKTCLNCARCVDACAAKMAIVGATTLVALQMGNLETVASSSRGQRGLDSADSPRRAANSNGRSVAIAKGAGACTLVALVAVLLMWSVASRDVVQLMVRQVGGVGVELTDGEARAHYVVDIYNNGGSELSLGLRQSGLPDEGVVVDPNPLAVAAKGRTSARMTLKIDANQLHPGRNEFHLIASDQSGHARDSSYRIVFAMPITAPSGNARQVAIPAP